MSSVPATSQMCALIDRPNPPVPDQSQDQPDGCSYLPLVLIVLLALVPRVLWMLTQTPVISLEGSEYVRMAENLAQGKGLVGTFEGPETMYTPLFSLVTA